MLLVCWVMRRGAGTPQKGCRRCGRRLRGASCIAWRSNLDERVTALAVYPMFARPQGSHTEARSLQDIKDAKEFLASKGVDI